MFAIHNPESLTRAYDMCAKIGLTVKNLTGDSKWLSFKPRTTVGEAANLAADEFKIKLASPTFKTKNGKCLNSKTQLVCLVDGDIVELTDTQ
jgi:hypothetical protein